jgi:hypothetical protein
MEQFWPAHGQEPCEFETGPAASLDKACAPPRRGPGTAAAALRLALVVSILLGVIALLARRSPAPAPADNAAGLAYVEDYSLAPLIALALPRSLLESERYVARSRGAGKERRDTLAVGEWDADALFLRIGVSHENVAPAPVSLFVDLAMNSAGLGAAVLRSANSQNFVSAHGPVEWADATLSGSGGERQCIGFRLLPAGGERLFGDACGARESRIDLSKLECLIEALSVASEGLKAGSGANSSRGKTGCY